MAFRCSAREDPSRKMKVGIIARAPERGWGGDLKVMYALRDGLLAL